jgi:hypothetical protein
MKSNTDKFTSPQQAHSTLIARMSAASKPIGNSDSSLNHATLSSGAKKRLSIDSETLCMRSAKAVKAAVNQDKRGLPGSGSYASETAMAETVGVGLHRKACWMDCDTAAGRSQLER